MLPGFDIILERYIALIGKEITRTNANFRFESEDIRRLLEAYALAVEAFENRSCLETSGWPRQIGASAVALVLFVNNADVCVVNRSSQTSKAMTRRACNAFLSERTAIKDKFGTYAHPRLLSMPTLRSNIINLRPKLIIFDSDSMWDPDVHEEARNMNRTFNCGVLMFKSTLR